MNLMSDPAFLKNIIRLAAKEYVELDDSFVCHTRTCTSDLLPACVIDQRRRKNLVKRNLDAHGARLQKFVTKA